MRAFLLTLAYDGSDFFGWQLQPDCRTVQGELEQALAAIAGQRVRPVAAGRTDTGVHAWGQAVSFESSARHDASAWLRALNFHLPKDVRVLASREMQAGFHVLRFARAKRYRYMLQDDLVADPLSLRYAWHIPQRMNVEAMQAAAGKFVGKHDFASFESTGSPRVSSVRTILRSRVWREERGIGGSRVIYEVEADGFLYNMVRNLTGVLVKIGRGRCEPDWASEVLAARLRSAAAATAPPHGLYLMDVTIDPAGEMAAPSDAREP